MAAPLPTFVARKRPDWDALQTLLGKQRAGTLRLEELRTRPDPGLLLGIDRALAKESGRKEELEAHPQVVLFHGFPSVKRLRARLGD